MRGKRMSEYIKINDIPFRDLAEEHNTDIIDNAGLAFKALVAFANDMTSLPTIDIVHCEECKFKMLYDGETKYYYCALTNWSVDDGDFCSWGERIEE